MVHGAVHSLLRLILAAATLVLTGLAVLTWRLSDGPISMDFLAPYVAEAFNVGSGELQFRIESAILSWGGWRESPEIRVLNVNAIDQTGQIIAAFPEMTVRLSVLSILEGAPAPQEIILSNPVVRLTRTKNGELLFGLDPVNSNEMEPNTRLKVESPSFATEDTNESANILLEVVVKALSNPGGSGNLPGYLEKAAIRDATVVFIDQNSDTQWLVPSGNIELQRDRDGLRIDAELPYFNEGKTSEINARGVYGLENKILSLSFEFDGVRPSSFSPLVPNLLFVSGMEMAVSGTLSLNLLLTNTSASVESAQLNINQGTGSVVLPDPIGREYPIQQLTLSARSEMNFDRVVIDEMAIKLEDSIGIGPEINVDLVGSNLNTSPEISIELGINEVTLEALKAYWPEDIKPNTLVWIKKNLMNGSVSNVEFKIDIRGDSISTLDVAEFSGSGLLEDIDVTYIGQMPPVENTFGTLSLGLGEVLIEIESGQVNQLSTGGQLEVRSGRVRLHGLDNASDQADIGVRVDGSLKDIIALIDADPLNYGSALGIVPASVSGNAEVRLEFDFPLAQQLALSDIQIKAQATLEQTKIVGAAFGLDLEAGQLSLSLDNQGMNVSGTAALGGIRTGLTWRENFVEGAFRRQYALDAVVENNQRSIVGLDHYLFAPPYVDGPVRIEAIYTVGEDGRAHLSLESDLLGARLSIQHLNWNKSREVAALFSAELEIIDGRLVSIPKFSASSVEAVLDVHGQASFSEEGALDTLILDQSLIGNSQFSLKVVRDSDGKLDIAAEGAVLDGATFWSSIRLSDQIRSFQDQEDRNLRTPFRFVGRLDHLLLSSKGELTDVSAEIIQEESGLTHISLNGMVSDGDIFKISMQPDGDQRSFSAESKNGGAVLRVLGFGNDFVAGELSIKGAILEEGAVEGLFNINNFRLVDAPLLARLLSVASLTGIVDELKGNGISFSELNVPFSYSDNVFSIQDAAMYGASLGLTAKGQYDINQNTIDGEGTLIPAYALNSAIGSIPILGPILTGGEKSGGVFAATYAMRGNPDGAEVTVNPLAAFTPGFLRQIFRVFDPPPASSSPADTSDSGANVGDNP